MKTFLILISFLVALGQQIIAQQTQESMYEKFANQIGVLISKEYVDLGFMDQIDIRLVKMKNLFTNESYTGLRLEYMPGNEIISSVKVATIDNDEIDALIKAIGILQNNVLDKKYESQSDFTIKLRSGLIIGYFYEGTKAEWRAFVQINPKDPQSTIKVEDDRFAYLLKLLQDAKNIK